MATLHRKLQSPKVRSGALIAMLGVAVVFGLTVKLGGRASTALPSDINNDGVVNVFDLSALLSNWNKSGAAGDLNGDNTVNVFDLSTLLSNWGRTASSTPTPTATATPTPTATPVTTTLQLNDATEGTGINQFTYSGNWIIDSPAAAFQSDNHYSNTSGNYYTVKFTGTQAKIYAEKSSGQGIVGVSIDGGTETMVDAYATTRSEQQLLYTSPTFASGTTHTLKVRITGTKNASSSGTYAAADRVDVSGVVVTPTPIGYTPPPVVYCAGKTPCYGPSDMAQHTTSSNCWGYNLTWVIDLTRYAPHHPNGPQNINVSSICGKDIHGALTGSTYVNGTHYHHSDTINNGSTSQMSSYRVGYFDKNKP